MKRVYGLSVVVGLLITAIATALAYGQGFGPGSGPRHGSLVPWVVGRMIPRDQMRSIVEADKTNLKNLHSQVHTARQQLIQDLVAGKDIASDMQTLESAQNSLLAEKVKLAQNILGKLSPSQRGQVSQFLTQWNSMEESHRQQRMQLLQQFGSEEETR